MKKQKNIKKSNTYQLGNISEKKEKDIIQSIGSFHDFIIMEKKDKIKQSSLEFEKVESDNNFLKDFLILQHRPKQKKSRFSDFFKELKEQEKKNSIEEPKTEKMEEIEQQKNISNPQPKPQNQGLDSYDRTSSYFSISQFQNPNNIINDKKLFNNNIFSNTNSRSTSDSGFTGHGSSFSIKTTKTNFSNFSNNINNNLFNRNSINSNEGNIITNNLNNINNINNFNNNMFQRNSLNSNEGNIITNNLNNMNNNMYNLYKGNIGNMNIIFNNNTIVEKEFEPNIDMKKVLTLADTRTTLMIKNIPNKFTREKLLEIIDKEFKGTYNLFILPKDGNKNRNFGYSFINFFSSYYIPYFYHVFNGKKWTDTNSQKVCEITYSKFQGRNELISHYPNKIIYFNNVIKLKKGVNDNFFIPNEYKLLFKQLFPNQKIEENDSGFITKIPFYL